MPNDTTDETDQTSGTRQESTVGEERVIDQPQATSHVSDGSVGRQHITTALTDLRAWECAHCRDTVISADVGNLNRIRAALTQIEAALNAIHFQE